jgi:hypothetical protein
MLGIFAYVYGIDTENGLPLELLLGLFVYTIPNNNYPVKSGLA